MKYLIDKKVINSNHIVRAEYWPERNGAKARCVITLTSVSTEEVEGVATSDFIILNGETADRFWDAYAGDAYRVVV